MYYDLKPELASRARIAVGRIGSVEVEPNTRVQLIASGGPEHRLALDDVHADRLLDIDIRAGLHTGEVLVGSIRAGGDYTAMGDVVNTAARLQNAAAPGGLVVRNSTIHNNAANNAATGASGGAGATSSPWRA